jgi:hypothetical protein
MELTKKSNDEEESSHGGGGPLHAPVQVGPYTITSTPVLGPLLLIVFVVHLQHTLTAHSSQHALAALNYLIEEGLSDEGCP